LTCDSLSLKDPVKDKLKRFGLFAIFGEEKFFSTIGAAVSSYLKSHTRYIGWIGKTDRSARKLSGVPKEADANHDRPALMQLLPGPFFGRLFAIPFIPGPLPFLFIC
jgi:hypothetical protein